MGERKPLITGNPKLTRRSDATVDLAAYSDAYDAGAAAERERWQQPVRDLLDLLTDVGNHAWNTDPDPDESTHEGFTGRQDEIERKLADLTRGGETGG